MKAVILGKMRFGRARQNGEQRPQQAGLKFLARIEVKNLCTKMKESECMTPMIFFFRDQECGSAEMSENE